MKKSFLFLIFALIYSGVDAQTDRTQLSKDVSKNYAENFKNLSQYTWQRSVEGFVDGSKIMTSLSSVQFGPDGKPVATVIQQSFEENKNVQVAAQKKSIDEIREYVKNAIDFTSKYVYLSDSEMADLFAKGTISVPEINSNVIQAEAFNFLNKGDHLVYMFNKNVLLYLSQEISTVMNGDPIKAVVTYETANGLNRVIKIEVTLPVPNIRLTLLNSDFARKL